MGQILTGMVTGTLAILVAKAIILLLGKLGKIKPFNRIWLLILIFLFGASLGIYSYPKVFSQQKSCESLGTSEKLTSSAWKELDKGNYARALDCTQICINRYSQEAKNQQQYLTQQGGFATGENIPRYWALNDVATCWFIRGEIYRAMREIKRARKAYQQILDNYSYGQCWDPRGWYWKLADGAKEKLRALE